MSIYCRLETTQVEAKLCAVEEDTFEVYLYATVKNEKVSKKFGEDRVAFWF